MVIECQPPINPDIENQPPFDPSAQQFDPSLPFALDPTQAVNGPIGTTPIPNITAPDNLKAIFSVLEDPNVNAFKTPDELFGDEIIELGIKITNRVDEITEELDIHVIPLTGGSTFLLEDAYDTFYFDTYDGRFSDENPDPSGPLRRPGAQGLPAPSININQRKNQLEFEREMLEPPSPQEIQRTSFDESFFIVNQEPFFPDQGNLFLGNVQNDLNNLHIDLYGTPPGIGTPAFNPNFYNQPRSIDDFGNLGISNLLGDGGLILGHAGAQLNNLPNTLGMLNGRSQFGVQLGESDPCSIFDNLLNSLLGDLLGLLVDLLSQVLSPLFSLLAILGAIINELLGLLGLISQLLNLGFAQNLLNLNPCSLPFMDGLATPQLLNAINLPSRVSGPNLGVPLPPNPFF